MFLEIYTFGTPLTTEVAEVPNAESIDEMCVSVVRQDITKALYRFSEKEVGLRDEYGLFPLRK